LKLVSLDFVVAAVSEMKFEISFTMKSGTAQSCRGGKRFKEM
jgi:hypothetical protein